MSPICRVRSEDEVKSLPPTPLRGECISGHEFSENWKAGRGSLTVKSRVDRYLQSDIANSQACPPFMTSRCLYYGRFSTFLDYYCVFLFL